MNNVKPSQDQKITVFYDGACGLCAKEINHYKKIAPQGVFEWIDITHDLIVFEALGYTKEEGLRALHALDHGGDMHKGIDAFLLIWGKLKHWRLLVVFVSLPGVVHLVRFFYKHFANWRFKKLGYGLCKPPTHK
jgi:predicted DCC family thiol-disulfide oxidoreductase YuxK